MKSIKQLASKIREERCEKIKDCKRLTNTLNKFKQDFKLVIPELIACEIKYEPCFLYKRNDKDFNNYNLFPQETEHIGSVCMCNSILFTFEYDGEQRRKRLFYNEDNDKGWYYIARNGGHMNADLYLKDHRNDLILYLDGTFEGEYK